MGKSFITNVRPGLKMERGKALRLPLCILCITLCFPVICFPQTLEFQTLALSGGNRTGNGPGLISTLGTPISSTQIEVGSKGLQSGFLPATLGFSNNFPPAINFTHPDIIGAGDKISATITDLDGIKKAWLYYRPIAANKFDSIQLTAGASNAFEASVQNNFLDALGMEYYFKAEDNTGLKSTVPATSGTYFQSYKDGEGAFVPQTAFNTGTKMADYRIIAIPFELVNPSIGTQFGELGDHKKSAYRIATYAGNGNWFEFPDPSVNVFSRGKGYWFLTAKSAEQLSLEGESVPHNYRSSLFKMTLQPEWNQIGNPYPLAINWNDVIAYNNNPDIGTLMTFDHGYQDANELKPFEGGFVKYNGTSAVTIEVPFQGQVSAGGRARSDFTLDIGKMNWLLRLVVSDGEITSSIAAIGIRRNRPL